MAIQHAHTDTTNGTASTGATTTITVPTGSVSTDVLIVVFGNNDVDTTSNKVTGPAGWTRIGVANGLTASSGSNAVHVTAFWALGNVASLAFTNEHTASSQGWVCLAFSGVDTTTPIDVQDTTGGTSTGNANVTAPAVTIATANAWEMIAAIDFNGGTFTATGFTVSEASAANATGTLLYNTTPKGTGSTGTVSVASSASATGQILACFSFALRPAAAAANPFFGMNLDMN